MASAAGLLNQPAASGHSLAGARVSPMASSNSDTNSASSTKSSAGITANDFLTLLVTEMKNQDPTANTDPNQYINQLVNLNSLQQLISINETLTAAYSSSNTSSYAQPTPQANATKSVAAKAQAASEPTSVVNTAAVSSTGSQDGGVSTLQAFLGKLAHGNLSTPPANPAAERLARALGGRSSAPISK
jgi:flagellar basal-body rod modification protein FlgD